MTLSCASPHASRRPDRLLWETGKSLVFDDTNLHEVWNESGEERVVLFLQFSRPLRSPGHEVRQLFLRGLRATPYVTVPLRNVRRWEAEFQTALEQRGVL